MRRRWIIGAAALVAVAIAGLWLARPEWGICVDGVKDGKPYGYCDDGVFSLAAIIGTGALVVLLAAYTVLVVRSAGRATAGRARVIGMLALGAAVIAAFALLQLPIEEIPTPYP